MTSPTNEPEPDLEPRGKRTTARLIGGATALGVLVGVCAGYVVQAGRDPKLPTLVQPALPQARGPEPEPLSAAADRKVRNDGDLRELLLEKPRGAITPDWVLPQGWADLETYASSAEEPEEAAAELAEKEFLRAAVTGWDVGSHDVEIWLAQYGQKAAPTAPADDTGSARYWAETDLDVVSRPIPGTGEGMAYVHPQPVSEPGGGAPFHSAEAHAWRGDIAVHVWIRADAPIPTETIVNLARRQLERL
ncbi:hypothetical protein [Streptomyces sp. NPDC002328]|uniref:hypothetical protein n=1 Tax=Streptomyces sp. NPDC002328 TaxID=3364642 RepID=UPI00369F0068